MKKITESEIRQIIKEELQSVLQEGFMDDVSDKIHSFTGGTFGTKKKKPATPSKTNSSTLPQYDKLNALKAANDSRDAAYKARERDEEHEAWQAKRIADEEKRKEEEMEEERKKSAALRGTVRRHFY